MVKYAEEKVLQAYWDKENHVAAGMPGYCERATRALFDDLLPDVAGKRVLDIGCGHGQTLEYFKSRGAIPQGIDLSLESVRTARNNGWDVQHGDCCALPYNDNTFDVVFSIGVIEHFDATQKAINEHIRVLKKRGIAIIIVPHLVSITYFGAVLWHFIRGNFLNHSIKTTTGKGYTKGYFRHMLDDGKARSINVIGYYGSAFLKPLTNVKWARAAAVIDKSSYSKAFGHLIAGVYEK